MVAAVVITLEKLGYFRFKLSPKCVWSMDFMADRRGDGRAFQLSNVPDDFNRERLAIEVDFSLPVELVILFLNQILE